MLQLGGMVSTGVAGISCSWCGLAYHSSPACQEALRWTSVTRMTVTCHVSRVMCHVSCVMWCCRQDLVCGLGVHSGLIMPPHWILKLPSRGRVQSSFR